MTEKERLYYIVLGYSISINITFEMNRAVFQLSGGKSKKKELFGEEEDLFLILWEEEEQSHFPKWLKIKVFLKRKQRDSSLESLQSSPLGGVRKGCQTLYKNRRHL